LKTGLAGEILQKFSTYNMRLGIVGDFSAYTSKVCTISFTKAIRTEKSFLPQQ
jgi:hypothetical protein